jgi:hypothetical protein
MSDNNGWADQPGVPLNPAEPGFHWVESCDGTATVVFWRGHGGDTHYENGDSKELNHWSGHPMWQAKEWTYLGPCLTPAEVDARIDDAHKEWLAELNHDTDALMEAARDSALANAARIARHYATIVPMHGSLKCDIYEAAAQAATEIAASIEALSDTPTNMVLVPREPTDAMIKSCLQAALDFMAETKTTEIHPGQTYPSPSENARRCWRAMVKAAEKGEGDE